MAQALEKALSAVAELSDEEQGRLGEWILAELESDRAWNERFTKGAKMLADLAKEALNEHRQGETTDLNFGDR